MSRLTMREATVADLPVILALLADDHLGAARDDPAAAGDAAYLDAFHEIDASPTMILAVAERAGEIVGTLQLGFLRELSNRGQRLGVIEAVRVAAPLRGSGFGAEMMDWALDTCRARGCATVYLKSHRSRAAAHRFYERLGFAHSHVAMTLPLGSQGPAESA